MTNRDPIEINLPLDQIICGDNVEVMRTFPDACIDAIVTDPPYGLSFMGKKWDYDVPSVECWMECLRVLKPGGHLLAFAGTRTQHRMAVRIEDAGFEIRDMIAWVYGSGFPKSLDIGKAIDKAAGAEREVVGKKTSPYTPTGRNESADYGEYNQPVNAKGYLEYAITAPATEAAKQWDGWGSALKPALEPITMARKPLDGTIAGNVLKHGVGGINVDGCRVEGTVTTWPAIRTNNRNNGNTFGEYASQAETGSPSTAGRFPANLILSYPEDSYDADGNLLPNPGKDEVVGLFPETTSGGGDKSATKPSGKSYGQVYGDFANKSRSGIEVQPDSGSAARFFYCAKADSKERRGSNHPTVKPLDLMRYLVRLVSPIGAIVLDPFAGSGTTLEAAKLESCRFIGIELDPDHCETGRKRLSQGVLF